MKPGGSIPRLIHQSWKTARVPAAFSAYVASVRRHHPGWDYRLWTDADNRAFVADRYPRFLAVFDALPRPIMRADVMRYLLMDALGGVYLDLDYEVLKPFDEAVADCELLLPLSRETAAGDPADHIGNCVFASRPGHPFWGAVIAELSAHPPPATGAGDGDPDVEALTGPGLLTRVFYQRPEAFAAGLRLAPRGWFHPPTPGAGDDAGYGAIAGKGEAFGIHHCHGTWRPGGGWGYRGVFRRACGAIVGRLGWRRDS